MTHSAVARARAFGRAYLWMLPGIVASYISGGMVSGGWGPLTALVFAGAARAEGLHGQVPVWRLALHRFFSFIGTATGMGLIFIVIAGVAWLPVAWLAPESAWFGWFWLGTFAALAWWPLARVWMAPALPFIVEEDLGKRAPFSYFLWVGPGILSAVAWSRVPGQWRRGAPVMLALVLVAAVFLLACAPRADGRVPLAVATAMAFVWMPVTVHVWLRCGRRAYRVAIHHQQLLWRLSHDPSRRLTKLSAGQLLTAGVEADDRYWIELAVRGGVDAERRGPDGDRPLHRAAFMGHAEAAAALVANGANPDATDRDGCTPLAIAAEQNRPEMIVSLARAGGDPDGVGGQRPLCLAARRGHAPAVEQLLALGAGVDPAAMPEPKNWPLLCAVTGGNRHVVERIIRAGARLPDDVALQRRLLGRAVESRNVEILRGVLTLFDPAALARELPVILRNYAMQESDRPAGYGDAIAELERVLEDVRGAS